MTTENTHFDFDAFMGEMQQAKGPTITIFGKEEELPSELPAIVTVRALRMMKKGKDAEAQIEELMEISNALFGKKRLDEWLANGLGMNGLEVLITKTIELYNPKKTPSRKRK